MVAPVIAITRSPLFALNTFAFATFCLEIKEQSVISMRPEFVMFLILITGHPFPVHIELLNANPDFTLQ